MLCKCETVQPLLIPALSKTKSLSLAFVYKQPDNFQKINLEENKFFGLWKTTYHTLFIYRKMLLVETSFKFFYVWKCKEL